MVPQAIVVQLVDPCLPSRFRDTRPPQIIADQTTADHTIADQTPHLHSLHLTRTYPPLTPLSLLHLPYLTPYGVLLYLFTTTECSVSPPSSSFTVCMWCTPTTSSPLSCACRYSYSSMASCAWSRRLVARSQVASSSPNPFHLTRYRVINCRHPTTLPFTRLSGHGLPPIYQAFDGIESSTSTDGSHLPPSLLPKWKVRG